MKLIIKFPKYIHYEKDMNLLKNELETGLNLEKIIEYIDVSENLKEDTKKRKQNNEEYITIKNYIKQKNISGFIVGLPLDDKGEMTKQALDCQTYGKNLSNELNLPFSFVNEHSSTWESKNRFGIKKDKSGLIDSFSAKIILEQWIREGPELKELVCNNQI